MANEKYDTSELLEDLAEIVDRLGRAPTVNELRSATDMASYSVYHSRFGGLDGALDELGLNNADRKNFDSRRRVEYSEEHLLSELQELVDRLGRPPTIVELTEAPEITATYATYRSYFDGLGGALDELGIEFNPENGSGEQFSPADCRDALESVAEQVDGPVSIKVYEEHASASMPSTNTITRVLGDGRWNAAKEAAGLDTIPAPDSKSEEEYLDELREVAERVGGGENLSIPEYKRVRDDDMLSAEQIIDRAGGWDVAKEAAGLDLSTPGGGNTDRRYSDEECLAALERVTRVHGELPSVRVYRETRRDGEPTPKTIRNRFGSWTNAKDKVDLEGIP